MSFEERALAEQQGLCIGRVINEYKQRFGPGDFLIRNIVSIDAEGGFFAVSDPFVRVGQTVQFHVRDAATAEADLRLLLEAQKLHEGAGGAMLFTCNSRGTMLFDEPHLEPRLISEALGSLPLTGGFVAGELGPIDGDNFLLGHSASLVVLRERNNVTPIV
jgi:small ligand-binding sensory domain FIST